VKRNDRKKLHLLRIHNLIKKTRERASPYRDDLCKVPERSREGKKSGRKSESSCNSGDGVYSRCKSGRAYISTCVVRGRSIANETQSSPHDDTAIGLLLVKQGVVPNGRDVGAWVTPSDSLLSGNPPEVTHDDSNGSFVPSDFPKARPIIDTRNHSILYKISTVPLIR